VCICTMRCPARRRVQPHKPRRHSSAPSQACDHHSLALLWRAHDHTLMHVACSRRGYQLRLQSVVGIRIASPVRFSSVTAGHRSRNGICHAFWSSRTATKPTRRAHAVTPPSVAALPIPKHEACTSRVRSGLQGPSGSPVAVSRTMRAWRLGPQRAASANDTHMISRLAAHGQQAALLLVVATDAQPRWPSDRACERGERGHHQTPFVSCTTGTIKTSLTTAPHLRLTMGTSVEERVCR
jgi:hypothetical protein